MAERILMNEYKTLSQEPWVNIDVDEQNLLHWTIGLIVLNPDSLYYGGYFKAIMKFPSNYPYSPPEFRFVRPLYHPNIYKDGKLCISILHAPGEDEMSGELASERWSPAQRVESVLISILSLLDDAEISSPANVDASVMLRKSPDEYKSIVKKHVEESKNDIPEGFVMPTHESTTSVSKPVEKDDSDFWAESDVDDDVFGGSDSDEDLDVYDDDEDQDSGSDEEEEDEHKAT
ncbi:putative ubiquitin conjugating enzyme (UbcC) [Aspergillus vadensis CBS 113365]|uniref:Ubiquitin-conjugating enzyme E2 2 n=1 Tax=Aspergillus vadensis (strain CBS 113365 / IMI 142717 / IBT 24658) TaxID=1448311 RepID=A0A319BAL9_ASPVC|nr:ubiquitin-conjugating enzyme [Aspergillus vadensis CBS 113365]PYH70016.1 ubiquitin-conjugating enzyme [Aspergillus vadensis CBS 113365]